MPKLNIALVEPQIPQNTGNIARTCAATGASLHLIEPLGFKVDDAKLKRAGLDYWHMLDITYYAGIEDFFARTAGSYYFFTTKGAAPYSEADYSRGDDIFLVFGREDAGLPSTLLSANRERCFRIPMKGGARSLNLSNSVAVVVYEALRQWGFPGMVMDGCENFP
ncbi:MAG: tRNA (cytidine(34)-2'-O)-methyltransferase [Oscillospiraceae bacterium]|nr:tRNA (cytidine(34)-2'-O)-methyltransferase [Oscillospiraceae bacterium]